MQLVKFCSIALHSLVFGKVRQLVGLIKYAFVTMCTMELIDIIMAVGYGFRISCEQMMLMTIGGCRWTEDCVKWFCFVYSYFAGVFLHVFLSAASVFSVFCCRVQILHCFLLFFSEILVSKIYLHYTKVSNNPAI